MAQLTHGTRAALDADADHDGGAMGLLDHLEELRTRLIRACLAVGVGMTLAAFNLDRLGRFMFDGMKSALPPGTRLVTQRMTEGFAFYFDVALIAGVVLAAPLVLFQVWRFIAPGLYSREKRLVLPFLAMSAAGTAAGVLFAHGILFPSTARFLHDYNTALGAEELLNVTDTFSLYKGTLLSMIAVFQLPTLIFFLARIRLVTARLLWRHLKHAVLVSVIASAFLTATGDPANQLLMAAPMVALYLVSIGVAWLSHPGGAAPAPAAPLMRLVVSATALEEAWRVTRTGHAARRRGLRVVR